MEPRPRGRGNPDYRGVKRPVVRPSMEPRPRGRGNPPVVAGRDDALLPSMEPRPRGWGNTDWSGAAWPNSRSNLQWSPDLAAGETPLDGMPDEGWPVPS